MKMLNKKELADFRKKHPVGARVELVSMAPPQEIPTGMRGTVRGVDDAGNIMVSWDNGSGLSLIYGEDFCRVLEEHGSREMYLIRRVETKRGSCGYSVWSSSLAFSSRSNALNRYVRQIENRITDIYRWSDWTAEIDENAFSPDELRSIRVVLHKSETKKEMRGKGKEFVLSHEEDGEGVLRLAEVRVEDCVSCSVFALEKISL